ncbi:peptidoglycan DD-metalloendopeptidase family protein [Bacillus sp. AG4(2022)]|uniref:murein hydrolase activator EnvC family protein n=1 Tax=Bacillus TaxID=1386 RepID=UPI002882BFDF|nr:peptidoglycan DD-metalloendopeptidase family protein [Bacillus sp. AG4(2022)]MDT0162188.1 peptidoglycan DD-metalloendopeptidase family protein [Bacillus sp. AG4(2022)]
MKKSIAAFSVATAVGLGSIFGGIPASQASASKISDLESKKNQIQEQRSGNDSKINSADSEINRLQGEQDQVSKEIERLSLSISDTETKIKEKTEQIAATKEEIEKLKAEIVVITDRINKRNEMLKDRARSFQENGGMVSYLDVLMGAQNFSDFIDRVGAVATIVEADQDILREHEADKKLLEETQAKVESELSSLEKMRTDLESMKKQLNAQKAEKNKLMASLKNQEEHKHAEKLNLEEENELLAAQEAAIKQAIELEKKHQAELARQAELERQRRAAAAAAAKKNSSSGSSSSSSSSSSNSSNSGGGGGGPVSSAPSISGGNFTKPAAGVVTSGLGQRWGTFHAGVDIAKSGTVPIVAAADGVVIRSYFSSSYGNAVFIAHSIDGQVYTTVYAHMSSRSIGTGATVSKGQQIGIMGNTGDSQGQHLHFELHRGPWNASKSNAINPIGIVPM